MKTVQKTISLAATAAMLAMSGMGIAAHAAEGAKGAKGPRRQERGCYSRRPFTVRMMPFFIRISLKLSR